MPKLSESCMRVEWSAATRGSTADRGVARRPAGARAARNRAATKRVDSMGSEGCTLARA